MATMRTTAKRNPITGEPVPVPAYARGRSTNFAGTDRKRTPDSNGFYNAGERNAKMKADKALVKSLDDSFKASQKSQKAEVKTKKKEENKAFREKKQDARQLQKDIKASKRGRYSSDDSSTSTAPLEGKVIKNRKVKIVKGGGFKKVKVDKSCKGPKAWMD
jgi:hypothetical protein